MLVRGLRLSEPPDLDIVRFISSAVCHQIPGRMLEADGFAMPLCARCSGMYIGFFLALSANAVLSLRRRAVDGAAARALALISVVVWAADGAANEFGLLHTPHAARFGLGLLMGLSLSPIIVRLFLEELGVRPENSARRSAVLPALTVLCAALITSINVRPMRAVLVAESVAAVAGLAMFLLLVHAALILTIWRRCEKKLAFAAAVVATCAEIFLLAAARAALGV